MRTSNFRLYVRKDAYRKPQVIRTQSTCNETPGMRTRNRTQSTRTGNLTIFVRKRCTGNLTLFLYTVRVQETSRYMYTRYAYKKPHTYTRYTFRTPHAIRTQSMHRWNSRYSYTKYAYRKLHVLRTLSMHIGKPTLFVQRVCVQETSSHSYRKHAHWIPQVIRTQCMHTGHLKLFVLKVRMQDTSRYSDTMQAYRTSQIIRTQCIYTEHLTLIPALRHLETASGTPGLGGSIIAISPTNLRFSSGKLTSSGSKANPLGNSVGGSTKSQKPGNERMIMMLTHICPEILDTLNTLKQKAILLLQTVASYKKQQQREILNHLFFE